jgi:diadenosine tetraphosphate (Ap4A) HIT family hydrolase
MAAHDEPWPSCLEPERHVPHVTDPGGDEARACGAVLTRVYSALGEEAAAAVVSIHVFDGGVPHLHVHIAQHSDGDAVNTQMIRGAQAEQPLPSGATALVCRDFPPASYITAARGRGRGRPWADLL